MKKSLLFILLLTAVAGFTQPTKGRWILGGSDNMSIFGGNIKFTSSATTEKYTTTASSLQPSFAYFVINNFAIGLKAGIGLNTDKYADGSKDVSGTFQLEPRLVFYFPLRGMVKPAITAGVGIESRSYKTISSNGSSDKNNDKGLVTDIGAGIAWFVKDNISLDIGVLFSLTSFKENDTENTKIIQTNFGPNIGFSIYF